MGTLSTYFQRHKVFKQFIGIFVVNLVNIFITAHLFNHVTYFSFFVVENLNTFSTPCKDIVQVIETFLSSLNQPKSYTRFILGQFQMTGELHVFD